MHTRSRREFSIAEDLSMEQLVWATGGTGATADSGAPRAGRPPAVDILTNVREAAPTAAALARIVWATTR
ncbi:hypothetical protein [Acidiphilium acidophilum]|uniref:Uncharacterized protein n=1 Tax=Acidiphilium acidophilum TaxID=76588 RepID=A0AAW9DMI2_ACIAO|nr:hypothetical protein [Acidiphilium acidophilum]MDX5929809.1 hypothetical protein [Acidiphilium acidophilum]